MNHRKIGNTLYVRYSIIAILCSFNALYATSNWKSSSSTSSNDDIKQVNFYGTLKTQQGDVEKVSHILIDGKDNDITVYEAPTKHTKAVLNQKTKQAEIKLDKNPATDFLRAKIKLQEIKSLKVVTADTVWTYQKEKKVQPTEFLLIEISFKDVKKTKQYLLERKTQISCTAFNNHTEKKEAPLAALDILTVDGYAFALENTEHTSAHATVYQDSTVFSESTVAESELPLSVGISF